MGKYYLSQLVRLIIILFYLVDTTSCIRCYVCGNEDDFPCTDFEIEDVRYQKECSNDKSCKISRSEQGNRIISRSCESNQFKDCIIANFVEYCYCIKDYCNKISPSDDEDEDSIEFLEGSGNEITENQESTSKDKTILNSSTEEIKNSVLKNEVIDSVLVSNNKKSTSKGASEKSYVLALVISFLWTCLLKYV